MKHILLKGEKNEEEFGKNEMIELNRVACEFLVFKHGLKPTSKHKKLLANEIQDLFPKIQYKNFLQQMNDKFKNMNRKPKPKAVSKVERLDARASRPNAEDNGTDFEEFMKTHKISPDGLQENETCSENEADYLMEEIIIVNDDDDYDDVEYLTQ